MDEHDGRDNPPHGNLDPFAGLEDWARDAERRVQRERQLGSVRRKLKIVVGVVGTLAILVGGFSAVRWWTSDGGVPTAYPTQGAPDGISATTSTNRAPDASSASASASASSASASSASEASASEASAGPASAGPFAGTPAAGYPKGAAGITLPPATAVTGFTRAQVGAALQQVRRALMAGRLDDDMLVGHRQAGLVKLLAPHQRVEAAKWFTSSRFDGVATWIDPAVRLDPAEQPRVSGRVTYASVRVDDIATLRVTTNFIWVYAFSGGGEHPIAAAHDEIQWDFPSTRNLRPGDRGMWIGNTRVYLALVDCAAAAKGLLAPTPPHAGTTSGSREDPDALLKADHTLDITDNCP